MSWVLIDDGVPNHPKFLQAGPAASWLWVCGLAYCRRHHTNGLMPRAAIPTLGVLNPRPLIEKLVAARLWDVTDDGWRIHDYQQQYGDDADTKAEKDEKSRKRREAGRIGGLAKASNRLANASGLLVAKSSKVFLAHRSGVDLVASREGSGEGPPPEADPPLDVWLRELTEAYPAQGRTISHLTEKAFVDVFSRENRPPIEVYACLRSALENHKRGQQWAVKRMIPNLEKWLREGLYAQSHEDASTPPATSPAKGRYADLVVSR